MNIQMALTQNVRREIEETEAEAARALEDYVVAQQRLMELRSLEELRSTMARYARPSMVVHPAPLEVAS